MQRGTVLTLLTLALVPTSSVARTLSWSEIAVTARLDAEGRLHVEERQAMVFDGAWNGGERTFRLGGDQSIELHGMTRSDPGTGDAIEMRKGSLDRVDHYNWTDGTTLRWRSRMPADPEFDNQTIVYVLDYTLSGVLEKRGGGYVLDHDFAFPNRFGNIDLFTLDLEIDPVWVPQSELGGHYELENLTPGRGYVLTTKLDYGGTGRPAGVFVPPPFGIRLPLIGAALAVIVVLFMRFRRWESDQGRYEPPDVPTEPGRHWIEEHLLSMRPEVVGALWDQSISGPEVSALLARLVAEGKLASRVEKTPSKWRPDILHLELLVDRDVFESYERKLINKLFFGGRTETSTEEVRDHYKSSGFSPSSAISAKLRRRTESVPGFGTDEPAPSKLPGLALLGGVFFLVVAELVTRTRAVPSLLATLAVAIFVPAIVGYIGVSWRRRKADRLLAPTLLLLMALGFALVGLWGPVLVGHLLFPIPVKMSWFGMTALLVFGVTVANSFFNNARTRDSKEAVLTRKRLAAIRDYFKVELSKGLPNLDDEWFPYLLAFGLAKDIDRWSVAHGGERSMSTTSASSFSGSSGGGSAGGWSGGGGTFGGAGATAGWAAAATGLAAGVAAPSSSGGGGGGGGGGGSSGGGGGGGW